MSENQTTDDRILSAFLRLAAERGLEGVTTRDIAAEAGVNPVTLFRRFGDKLTIAVEAIRRYSPVEKLKDRDPGVDPAHVEDTLLESLLYVTELALDARRTPFLRFNVKQMEHLPEIKAEMAAMAQAIYGFLRRALEQAAPALRPEVDLHVTVLQLVGLLKFARQMDEVQDVGEHELDYWRSLFRAALRPLLREV